MRSLNQRGATVLALAFFLGLGLITITSYFAVFQTQARGAKAQTLQARFSSIRQDLLGRIANQAAWRVGWLFRGSTTACLPRRTCRNGDGGALIIADVSGQLYYDSSNPAQGFTLEGVPCTGFSATGAAADATCVIRADVSWRARCEDAANGIPGSCTYPEELITIRFRYAAPVLDRTIVVNPAPFEVTDVPRMNLAATTGQIRCADQSGFLVGQGTMNGHQAYGNGCIDLDALGDDPPTEPPSTRDELWTWQGLICQTTCPFLCDGREWATCTGRDCPSAQASCYFPSWRGRPLHPVGSTQTTTPAGYECYPFIAPCR